MKVETELYAELKRDLGKNFELFKDTVNLKEGKRKGPFVPPEPDMGSRRMRSPFRRCRRAGRCVRPRRSWSLPTSPSD